MVKTGMLKGVGSVLDGVNNEFHQNKSKIPSFFFSFTFHSCF